MKKPKGWRTGQTIYNFLYWLRKNEVVDDAVGDIADPFHLSDEAWDKYYKLFLEEHEN